MVTLARVGFCKAEAKALGPVQEYVALVTGLAVSDKLFPAQTGLFPDAIGLGGIEFTITVCVAVPEHPLVVAVTVYPVDAVGFTVMFVVVAPPGLHI